MPEPRLNVLLDGERLQPRVLSLLTELELRESDTDPSVATLRFKQVQHPSGEMFPLDEKVFGPAATLAVDLAAPGGLPERLFSGYVTHIRPHFEPIEANSYLEILALDAAVVLDAQTRIASYPDLSDSGAAEEIFGRYNLSAEIEETDAIHQADRQLLVQRGTDWEFLRDLARRNGFCCFFEHDPDRGETVAHFHRPAIDREPQADLVILQEGENLRWIDVQLAAAGPVRHVGQAIDPILKRLVRGEGEPKLEALGERGLDQSIEQGWIDAGAEAAEDLLRDPIPISAAIAAEATGRTDRDRFAVQARGEVNPALYRGLLRARRPALIRGVGARFSGTYYVRSVRTTLRERTLTQTFTAERNALGQSGQEEFGQRAEEVPPE